MLQENALPNISEEERARIIKQVNHELRVERFGIAGAWIIAIITLLSIILLVALPTLRNFNPSKNEQILSSVTSQLLEENRDALYEFRRAQEEATAVVEEFNFEKRFTATFIIVSLSIIATALVILEKESSKDEKESSTDEKSSSIFGTFILWIIALVPFLFFVFVLILNPFLKVSKFNNASEQIKAIDYVETYIQKNYCNTFKGDEICVLSKGIDNPIKTWTSEQKVAMWHKLRAHEREVAQRADLANKEQIRKNNELTEQIKSIKIQ